MPFRRLVQSSDQLFPYHHPAQGRKRKIGLADGGVTTAAALEDFHRVDLPGRWQRNQPCQQLPGSFRQRQCAPGGIGRQDAGGLPVQGQGDPLRGNAGAYHPEGRGQCHRPGAFDPYMHGLWSPGCLSACDGLTRPGAVPCADRAPPAAHGRGRPNEPTCVLGGFSCGWSFRLPAAGPALPAAPACRCRTSAPCGVCPVRGPFRWPAPAAAAGAHACRRPCG